MGLVVLRSAGESVKLAFDPGAYFCLNSRELWDMYATPGRQTLHSELDEPATLSVGVDGMAGEEDRVPSLSGVKL